MKRRISLYPKEEEHEKPQYFEKPEKPVEENEELDPNAVEKKRKVKRRISLYPKEEEHEKPQYFEKPEKPVEESEKADPNVAIKDKKTNPNEAS